MASENLITLYDVASDLSGTAWSPNMWRARYVLNFKGIPYKTTWLEFPEIEPTLRAIGASPTGTRPDGSPHYTLPVIVDPSRRTSSGRPTVVSESFLIGEYLDDAYPSPGPLFPEGTKALQKLFYDHFFTTVMRSVRLVFLPEMHRHLNEGSRPYWRKTRELYLGGKLEEVCAIGSAKWEEVWDNIQKGLSNIATLLDNNQSACGPLVMGKHLTFSDLIIAAFLEAIFLVHPEEWRSRVCLWDGGRWKKLRDMCAKWRSVH